MRQTSREKIKRIFTLSLAVLMVVSSCGSIAMAGEKKRSYTSQTIYEINEREMESTDSQSRSVLGKLGSTKTGPVDNTESLPAETAAITDETAGSAGKSTHGSETVNGSTGETEIAENSTGETETMESSTSETKAAENSTGETETMESSTSETKAAENNTGENEIAENSTGETETVENSMDGSETENDGNGINEIETDESSVGENDTDETDESEPDESSNTYETDETDSEVIEITEWAWLDADSLIVWSEENARWELTMAGASEENPVSHDDIIEALPKMISILNQDGIEETAAENEIGTEGENETENEIGTESENGTENEIGTESENGTENEIETEKKTETELTWDLSAMPETAYEGEYTLTASAPENYTFSAEAKIPAVTVLIGGAETESVSAEVLEHNRAKSTEAFGTTVNMFDYWVDTREAPDNERDKANPKKTKINWDIASGTEHSLLFGNDMSGQKDRNTWTGSAAPRQGLVENVLVDGYPKMQNGKGFGESLSYLFDSGEFDGKAAFMGVNGLFQVDDENYYYYDCTQNYAYLDENKKEVKLYNAPGKISNDGNGINAVGQFFPFNDPRYVFTEKEGKLETDDKFNSTGSRHESLNHYFGVTMSTRFIQQKGGKTDAGKPVTYEFSGDDDVWIFIDDVLVADLGGIHNATSVKIDFTDGSIVINDGITDDKGKPLRQESNLKQKYTDAGKEEDVRWNGNTFADNTYHTLKFFYLERGNDKSNMSLRFNLVTVPESDIIKIDQVGNPIAGAGFTLYASDESYSEIDNETIDKEKIIASGVTDSDGTFVLTDKEGFVVSINDLAVKYKDSPYFILRETKIPPGYRMLGDAKLYLNTDVKPSVLLSADYWNTGTYAMSKVTATIPAEIKNIRGESYNEEQLKNGTIFAVVLRYTGPQDGNSNAEFNDLAEPENWKAVSGNAIDGWHVSESAGIEAVIAAAKENKYKFRVDSSGAYKAEVENMPGDITTYYYMLDENNKSKTEYTVAYYYTSGSLDDGTEKAPATKENTVRLQSDTDESTGYRGIDREFSVRLYVPNIKNQFFVQKVDTEGKAVNGAEFSLYKASDIQVNDDGTWQAVLGDDGKPKAPYDTVTTRTMSQAEGDMLNLEGAGMFPSNEKILPEGDYYLVETKAPDGYKINTKPVKVIAETLRVYADAGKEDDGIVVNRGVGYLVKSMEQFAADDDIDATLHDIKATLEVSDEFNPEEEWKTVGEATHLSYSSNDAELQYGPITDKDGNLYPKFLSTDTGWSRLKIQQCLAHENQTGTGSSPKQDLGDTPLGNLFSGTLIVQVTNDNIGNLKISKTVKGEDIPNQEQEFDFSLTLTDAQGTALAEEYTAVKYDKDENPVDESEELVIKNGKLSFSLKDGEYIYIKELPVGTKYTVEEKDVPDGFEVSVSVDGSEAEKKAEAEGDIAQSTAEKSENEAAFTNTYMPYGKAAVQVKKTLLGRVISGNDSFRFKLVPADEKTKAAVSAGDIVLESVGGSGGTGENSGTDESASAGGQETLEELTGEISGDGQSNTGTAGLGSIIFKNAGEYIFHISEQLPGGASEENPIDDGIIYDTHIASVTVTVSQKTSSEVLEATVVYNNSNALTEADKTETEAAAFTNKLSGDFSFTKQNKAKEALSGAVFGLYREICTTQGHSHENELIKIDAEGNPTGESADCWELVEKAPSDGEADKGKVVFTGLAVTDDDNQPAEYRLAEIKAPADYTKASGQWKIQYDMDTGKFIVPRDSAVGNPTAIAPDEDGGGYVIVNYKPGELPLSGGRGTALFMAAGAGLMSAAAFGALLYLKVRKRKHRAVK